MMSSGAVVILAYLVAIAAVAAISAAIAARSRRPALIHVLMLGPPIVASAVVAFSMARATQMLRLVSEPAIAAGAALILALSVVIAITSLAGGPPGKPHRAARWGRGSMASLALLALVATAALAGSIAHRDRLVLAEIAARRAAAAQARASLVDIAPDVENAATLYRQAFAIIDAHPGIRDQLGVIESPTKSPFALPDADTASAIDSTLAPISEAIELAVRAAALPRCDFGHDPRTMSYGTLMPELGPLRVLSTLVAAAARSAASRGDAARATELLRTLGSMAAHARENPTVIGALVSYSIDAVALKALVPISSVVTVDAAAIEVPPRWTARAALDRGLTIEHASFDETVCDVADGTPLDPALVEGTRLPVRLALPLRIGYRLLAYADEVQIADGAFGSMIGRLRGTVVPSARLSDPMRGYIVPLLLPALDMAVTNAEVVDTHPALRAAILAARSHRAETGLWPANWSDLVPSRIAAPPADAYAGAGSTMRLAVRDGALIIYSVGRDRTDDGGLIHDDDGFGKDDGVMLLPAQPAARSLPAPAPSS